MNEKSNLQSHPEKIKSDLVWDTSTFYYVFPFFTHGICVIFFKLKKKDLEII